MSSRSKVRRALQPTVEVSHLEERVVPNGASAHTMSAAAIRTMPNSRLIQSQPAFPTTAQQITNAGLIRQQLMNLRTMANNAVGLTAFPLGGNLVLFVNTSTAMVPQLQSSFI